MLGYWSKLFSYSWTTGSADVHLVVEQVVTLAKVAAQVENDRHVRPEDWLIEAFGVAYAQAWRQPIGVRVSARRDGPTSPMTGERGE